MILPVLHQKVNGLLRDDHGRSAVAGVYPCGEGAGYAGGILSAAVDGIRCAEWLLTDEQYGY